MGFRIPDLVVESVIRDGLERIKADNSLLDDIFQDLGRPYNSRKYGASEITKIKEQINQDKIAVVHSFHEAAAKSPCFSIQLGSDAEHPQMARLGDFEDDLQEQIVDNDALEAYHKVTNLVPDSYDPLTGKVSVPDSANLAPVYNSFIYVDGSDNEFTILPGISNEPGSKYFFIAKNLDPDIANPGLIKSFIDYTQVEIKGVTHQVSMMIGVHSKKALMTKYLYILLKYFILSRKADLDARGVFLATLTGSDFARDLQYKGDMVFNRFLTVTGKVEDCWRSDDVQLIDSVEIDADPVDC